MFTIHYHYLTVSYWFGLFMPPDVVVSEWMEPPSSVFSSAGSTGALSSIVLPAPSSLDWFGASHAKAKNVNITNSNFLISCFFHLTVAYGAVEVVSTSPSLSIPGAEVVSISI